MLMPRWGFGGRCREGKITCLPAKRAASVAMLKLGSGLAFADLYSTTGLQRVDEAFCGWLAEADAALASRLAAARAAPDALGRREESELLIALAPQLDDWLARLFGI